MAVGAAQDPSGSRAQGESNTGGIDVWAEKRKRREDKSKERTTEEHPGKGVLSSRAEGEGREKRMFVDVVDGGAMKESWRSVAVGDDPAGERE